MKKNNEKIRGLSWLLVSICFLVITILYFLAKDSMAVTYLCLTACFFCLSMEHFSKSNK